MLENKKITFIGGGHITEIILTNLIKAKVVPQQQILVSDLDETRLSHLQERFGVNVMKDNIPAIRQADLIMVNVRPEVVKFVIPDLLAANLHLDQTIISLAAGIPLSQYSCLGDRQPLVRALPNPPSQIGQGIAALVFTPQISAEQRQVVKELFATLGQYVEVKETDINLITSLSSPVETFLFFEALIDAGVRCGLSRPVSTQVAAQTIIGSMMMWQERQVSPYELINEASTPSGISVESLFTLEQHAFKAAIMEAIAQGAARADALGSSSTQIK